MDGRLYYISEIQHGMPFNGPVYREDWLEKLKETAPSAFKAGVSAPQIVRPAGGDGGMQVSKEAFAKMGYRERLELKKNNPEIYEKVKE